ncbi:hypothetical protein AQUCO_03900047v1, partial [Aquilegia coerulea]
GFNDGSLVRYISTQPSYDEYDPSFGLGFYCTGVCTSFLLAIFSHCPRFQMGFPQVVWSANRNNPVGENAYLILNQDGLLLRDANGKDVWSTHTSGKSILGLKLTDMGNLVLFDKSNRTVWESYNHPTDSLVLGQKLVHGKKLIGSTSPLNSTEGLLSLTVESDGLFAFVESNPPLSYSEFPVAGMKKSKEPSYVRFLNGSLAFYILNAEPNPPDYSLEILLALSIQIMRLESDGHLRVYMWNSMWLQVADLLSYYSKDDCNYPTVCGNYGICSRENCTCPESHFRPVSDSHPNFGCYATTPLSCKHLQYHHLIVLNHVSYFHATNKIGNIDIQSCKQKCLTICSCKAVFFMYVDGHTKGDCFIQLSTIFSLIKVSRGAFYDWNAFLKVQTVPNAFSPSNEPSPTVISPIKRNYGLKVVVVVILVGVILSLTLISCVLLRKKYVYGNDERYLDQIPGMPSRFSYKYLKVSTDNFSRKLGEGGFGTVYLGALANGTKIAVKRLNELSDTKSSFLPEVESICSIHHVNLVRLIGFCAHKSHTHLVYEYMCNGSLDKWIFGNGRDTSLDWKIRKKIILGVAKGLAYLHEECRLRILHLDIKPQNILLDSDFNAKVSDFGLCKLIDKDQSKVMTTMRGTPGYLAPEWLNSVITEKVDVYSFGVVVIEILCGRRNLDLSQPEESRHLLSLLEKNTQGNFHDMLDSHCVDMQLHEEEVEEMMKVAVWCLQGDFSKRPSMSVVVKVIEGVIEIESELNYSFLTTLPLSTKIVQNAALVSSPLFSSILSGPRT